MGMDIHMFVELEVKLDYAPTKSEFVLVGMHDYGGRSYSAWQKMDDKAYDGLPQDKSSELGYLIKEWGYFGFHYLPMKDFYKKIKHAERYLPNIWDKKKMKKMRVIWGYDH